MRIEHAYIAATGLPTSTQHNSKDCDTKISDLDEMVHGEYYQKYHTLAKQITLIGEIVDDLCRQKADRRILIISDHGLTALSRLYQPKKYEKKASHEGRYIRNRIQVIKANRHLPTSLPVSRQPSIPTARARI